MHSEYMSEMGIKKWLELLKYIHTSSSKIWALKQMSKKKRVKKTNVKKVHKDLEEQQPERSNTLIFGGVIIAMSSIGLLIFVLSDKVFHLS